VPEATRRLFAVAAMPLILLLAWLCAKECEGAEVGNPLALAKCRLIVRECYPNSGFSPWCGTLIREHERLSREKQAPGFASHWWWSLVYGGSNAELRVGATFPGHCSGPMDVKAWPLVLEPGANIRHHVAEAWLGYSLGYQGRRNCEYVFYPSHPHDWGGGRFRQTDARHRRVVTLAYQDGRLP
jgi:hypothetical protein